MKKNTLFICLTILAIVYNNNNAFAQKELKKETRIEKRVAVLQEEENGKSYKIRVENDEIASLEEDGKEVPKADYGKHKALLDRVKSDLKENMPPMEQMGTIPIRNKNDMGKKMMVHDTHQETEQNIKVKKNDKGQTSISINSTEGEPLEFLISGDGKEILFNGQPMKEGEIRTKNIRKEIIKNDDNDMKIIMHEGGMMGDGKERVIIKKFEDKNGEDKDVKVFVKTIKTDDDTNNSSTLEKALVDDGLVADAKQYSFELSAKQLLVNGEKMPSGIHRRYLKLAETAIGAKLEGDSKLTLQKK